MNKTEIVKTLIDARRLLADGWCQSAMIRVTILNRINGHCSVGALFAANGYKFKHGRQIQPADTAAAMPAVRVLAALLPDEIKTGCIYTGPYDAAQQLVSWNDVEGRTQEEVLALFDRGITAALLMVEDDNAIERTEEAGQELITA